MLDSLSQPERAPRALGLLERVECLPVRAVADRMDGDREPRRRRPAHDPGQFRAARDLHAAAVEHPRSLRAERPVHEHLQVAELHVRAAEARPQSDLHGGVERVVRDRLPHAQGQPAALVELLPQPQCSEPAVLVVHGGDAAGVREAHPGPHRVEVVVIRDGHVPLLEAPRGLFAQDAGRLAVLVAFDDSAVDVEIAVRERERRRVQPERVVVLGDQTRRCAARDRVELVPVRVALGAPVAAAPAVAAQPAVRGERRRRGFAAALRRGRRSRRV